MLTKPKPMARGSRTSLLSGKTYRDFRRIFDDIFSSSGEGRMTLEVLKETSATLLRFFKSSAVEIVYEEKRKLWHAKALAGPPWAVSGWKEKAARRSSFLDVLETATPGALDRLKSWTRPAKRPGRGPQGLILFPAGRRSHGSRTGDGSIRQVFLMIPAGRAIGGVVALTFAHGRTADADDTSLEILGRLGSVIGRSLSHNLSRFELRERVKELTCMYNIANLAVTSSQHLEQFLQKAAELLPAAYLYPEITSARITLDGRAYATEGFAESPRSQRADLLVGGLKRGALEVVYREPRPELDEGPFLAEERRLLDSVAREIAIIIERRQAEVEQARLQDQLRHADRLATIGKLAAGVAHELNEPLTGILGFAELLKEVPGLPVQAASDLTRIESAALHAREVVRKLLLFARQISPKQGPVAVNRLVQEVVAFFQARLSQKGIAVQTRLEASLPEILADESQIRQIVMNLAINAIQAMDNGGVLAIATRSRGGEIVLSVRDSGKGIPEDIRDKIFLPFFTTKDVDMGTGLGLSVVHGIVKSHCGRIKVASAAGRGAEFKVYLPLKQNGPAPVGGSDLGRSA
jgi:two-component system, NtrC family, sensor kinase